MSEAARKGSARGELPVPEAAAARDVGATSMRGSPLASAQPSCNMLSQHGAPARQGADAAVFEAEVEDAMCVCDDRFRSFDWETGTYTTYGGEVRFCPYLEPYVHY